VTFQLNLVDQRNPLRHFATSKGQSTLASGVADIKQIMELEHDNNCNRFKQQLPTLHEGRVQGENLFISAAHEALMSATL
jgi:hypothetical protein